MERDIYNRFLFLILLYDDIQMKSGKTMDLW